VHSNVHTSETTSCVLTAAGFFKDQFRTVQGSNFMASAEREPITGAWVQSPGGWSGGEVPLKLNALLFLCVQGKLQICPINDLQKSVNHTVNKW